MTKTTTKKGKTESKKTFKRAKHLHERSTVSIMRGFQGGLERGVFEENDQHSLIESTCYAFREANIPQVFIQVALDDSNAALPTVGDSAVVIDFIYDNHGTIYSYTLRDKLLRAQRIDWNAPTIPWWIRIQKENFKDVSEFPQLRLLSNSMSSIEDGIPEMTSLLDSYAIGGRSICVLSGIYYSFKDFALDVKYLASKFEEVKVLAGTTFLARTSEEGGLLLDTFNDRIVDQAELEEIVGCNNITLVKGKYADSVMMNIKKETKAEKQARAKKEVKKEMAAREEAKKKMNDAWEAKKMVALEKQKAWEAEHGPVEENEEKKEKKD